MKAIQASGLKFSYTYDLDFNLALDDVNIDVEKGEFIAIIGSNGSGKSTLIKLLNGLLPLQAGELYVNGINLRDEKSIWQLRRQCTMVFQNPDNQFVSPIVYEDIAFGLRNYGALEEEVGSTIFQVLEIVGLKGYEKRFTYELSGGEKQRAAIAGALAVSPDIIIFDEATSMLDPKGREVVIRLIERLNREEKKTVIMVTHYVEEAVKANKVLLMHNGKAIAFGTPRDVLCDEILMLKAGLNPPMPVKAYYDLKKDGIELKKCPLTEEELVEAICR